MDAGTAIAAPGGVKKEISIAPLDDVQPDDHVLIHAGDAQHRVSPSAGKPHAGGSAWPQQLKSWGAAELYFTRQASLPCG